MMRILITVGIFPPDIGGPATQIDAFCRALIKEGIKPTVLTFGNFTPEYADYPYEVIKISRDIFAPIRKIIYCCKVFYLAMKNDLIYTEDLYSGGVFSLLAAKILGKKLVTRFAGDSAWELAWLKHGVQDDIVSFQNKKYSWPIEQNKLWRRLILKHSDAVVAVSEFMKKLAVLIGAEEKKVKVIYNSVDFTLSNNPVIAGFPNKIGDLTGLTHNNKVLISAGRLVPWKNMGVFIDIMPDLIKKYGEIKLVIIGDGPEYNNLQLTINNLHLEKDIILMGKIPHEKIMEQFAGADIFILNTDYEGLSHTILEAMSAGAPVISTNIGGNPEVIQNGENGLLVGYNNKKQWQEAIEKLLDDSELRESFIAKARTDLAKFNWDNLINETVALFKAVL